MVSKAKTIGDLVGKNGKIFVKSNHGLCDDGWPAVSFTRKGDAIKFGENFNSDNDILIYVGTGQKPTPREYRKRILAIVKVAKSDFKSTKSLMKSRRASENWKKTKESKDFHDRYEYSFSPSKSYNAKGKDGKMKSYNVFLTSKTTRQLGFGRAIEVTPDERARFLSLEIGCDLLG